MKSEKVRRIFRIVADTLLKPTGSLIVAAAAGYLPWLSTAGKRFFFAYHDLPGWLIATAISVIVFAALFGLRQTMAIRRWTHPQPRRYTMNGLEWFLQSAFFLNCGTLLQQDSSDEFLRSAVVGPFCARCHRDASISIQVSRTCTGCGADLGVLIDERELPLAEALVDPLLDRMRRGVYVEAQSAVHRGELRS